MKKKILLSSILTIALCISLIAGATFALFTDSTQFNVAVTAGDVEIVANASIVDLWSAEGADTFEDDYLVDEKGNIYNHVNRTKEGTFINGGVAELTGANKENLTISRITPGDRVDLNINVNNTSDVAISYRYKITINEDNGLASGMVVTTPDKVGHEGLESYISAWTVIEPKEAIAPVMISVELPVYAGNKYQSEKADQQDGRLAGEKSVSYTVLVEAVQGNAVTEDESIVTILPETIQDKIINGGIIDGKGATLNLTENLTVLNRDVTVTNTVIDGTNADAGDATVPFLVAGGDLTLGAGAVVTAGDYGIFVMEGDKLTLDAGSKLIVPDGTIAAINGQVACNVFDLYINDTGLIVDEEGNVADTRIALLCGGTFRIHVPTVEAYDEYVDMIDSDTTYQTIEWYIDDKPAAYDAASLQAAMNNTSANYIYVVEDIADAVTLENVSNKTIDANNNDVSLVFKGTADNIVVKNITNVDDAGIKLDLSGATGNISIEECNFISGNGTSNMAIKLGANMDVAISECNFASAAGYAKTYGFYGFGAKDVEIVDSTFEGFASWAYMINGSQYGNLVVDGCTFKNCAAGLVKSGVKGDAGTTGTVGGDFVFTDNIIEGSAQHSGAWFGVKYEGTATISGNTMDGADWTPVAADGITDTVA